MEKTDNEIIAEFMDLDIDGDNVTDGTTETTLDKLQYDKRWDWLMPVVEKIEHEGYPVLIEDNYCRISVPDIKKDNIRTWTVNKKIEAVYPAVVEFIKWYNSQKNFKEGREKE